MQKNIFLMFNSITKRKFLLSFTFTFFILTTNAQVNFLWAKAMDGSSYDGGQSIAIDGASNDYTTGYFEGCVDFAPGLGVWYLTSNGAQDIFISKLDASGNFVWAKQIGGINGDLGFSIDVDALGYIYTTGTFQDTVDFDPGVGVFNLTNSGNGAAIFVSKLDPLGNFGWAKKLGGVGGSSMGRCIKLDATGNVYTTGYFDVTTDFDPGAGVFNITPVGGEDIFINKLNVSGNFVWAKSMGGVNTDCGYSIGFDNGGNIYTSGKFRDTVDFDPGIGVYNLISAGFEDIFVNKFNSSGTFVWAKAMGGAMTDISYSNVVDGLGNVYTTGIFLGTADFDPGPGVFSITSMGNNDIFISKLNASGNFMWALSMGGTANEAAISITIDQYSNIYTTGFFQSTVDFDPGAGAYYLSSPGLDDIFISILDISGTFVSAKNIGGVGAACVGQSIAVDLFGDVYTTGYFQGTGDFDPGPSVYNITAPGLDDVFVVKLNCPSLGISEIKGDLSVEQNIFPNPNNGLFTLQVSASTTSTSSGLAGSAPIINGELILINSIGQKVYEAKIIQGINTIQTNSLAKGLYNYILLSDKQKINSGKLVVE